MALDLLNSTPSFVTELLTLDGAAHAAETGPSAEAFRRGLAEFLVDELFDDLDADLRQQRLLFSILEDLVSHELAGGSEAVLRDSASPAVQFASALVRRRPECQRGLQAVLGEVLLQGKNATSDPALLAARVLAALRRWRFPAALAILLDVVLRLAPRGRQERLAGGLLFLRVVNPALVAFATPHYRARTRLDAARILQHLANGTPFSDAPEAAPFNAFLRDRAHDLHHLLEIARAL